MDLDTLDSIYERLMTSQVKYFFDTNKSGELPAVVNLFGSGD